ncbi:MAG: TonB-dependent receptor [Bacteroidales bacterium]|nr:TonB-dependent receptor [Bacteroidales bacterium]
MNLKRARLLLLSILLTVCAAGIQAQQMSVLIPRRQTVGDVLPLVKAQADVEFSYDRNILKTPLHFSGKAEGSLPDLLDRILEGTDIGWTIKNGNHVLLFQKQTVLETPAKMSIYGTVQDSEGHPVPGAVVLERGGHAAAITETDGTFSISVPPSATLDLECLGYRKTMVKAAGRSRIDVVMEIESTQLDELIVVGYRSVKKVSLTGAVSSVDIKAKESLSITNSAQLMYSTPGLWVNQGGAKPGNDGTSIRIRGVNSMNSTGGSPLVLLDGIEYDLGEIDPSTIESVTILKDVSAAIYGLKAANGVILVTSKKGAKGRTKVEYSGKSGIQQATYLPDVVTDPIMYMQLRNTAEINSGISPGAVSYSEAQIDEYRQGMLLDPCVYPASDWFDICLENGYVNQHSIRLSGGNDGLTYAMGLGYTGQKGVFIDNDDAQRYAFDLKLNAHVSKAIDISGTFQGNVRHYNEVGYGTETVFQTIMRALPIFSDYHRNNHYGSTWLFTPGRNNIENPRMEVEQGYTLRNYQELLATTGSDIILAPGLTYHLTGSYRKYDHFSKDFIPQMYTVHPKTGVVKNFNGSAPRVKDWDATMAQYTLSHRLVYEQDFGPHNLHIMAGQDWQHNETRAFQAYNHGFNDNTLQELSSLTSQTNARATGSSQQKRLISLYGRLAYTFHNRYMAEATLRRDGSSNLSPENRWHLFPSVLLAWNISQEDFFQVRWIDLLKVRTSWGIMGSESVSPYSYQMTYSAITQNYSFGGTPVAGYAVTELTDTSLGWEKTRSRDIGLDLTAFGGRLNFEADGFDKYTYDIIMTRSIPSYIGGLNGPKSNVGSVSNKGFELNASWRDTRGNFFYGVNGTATYVKNRVESLDGGQILANSNTLITTEGYPIRSYYLYEADGYYQSQTEIDEARAVYGSRTKLRPGYLKYKNNTPDEQIDEKDKIIVGNTIPEWTYSFGLNLGWKNLALSAQFQGVGDVYVLPQANLAMPFNNGAGVTWDWATDSWTPDNPDAKLPLLTTYTDAGENFIPSTHWLRNAKYLRLKNIQISYTFSKKLISKLRMNSLQVYVSGQNLWTLSDFNLWDPEITLTRTNLYEYPNLKTYTVGLDISF